MNYLKDILNSLYQIFITNQWVIENIKAVYKVRVHPGIIPLFPAILISPTEKTETFTTMPVSQYGRFVEFYFNIVCYCKFLNSEIVRLGQGNDLGIYDVAFNVEKILMDNNNIGGLVYWSDMPSTVYDTNPYGETEFLAMSVTNIVAKRKI